MRCTPASFALAAGAALPLLCHAQGSDRLEEIIVTGVRMERPLVLETDPRAPRQPLPAQDGADYLKTIPGFSVIRKGGTSGDPVFRGMAGSRVSMLIDGKAMLGGCEARMDPPTAYVYPEAYDRIRVIKGPQTVLYGPGNSAGVVLFQRDRERLDESAWAVEGSVLGGSFNRDDEVLNLRGGTSDFYLRASGSHSQQDDYTDGSGNEVHARYDRRNADVAAGWTPGDRVTVEVAAGKSDAEAAFADRAMDGAVFDAENLSARVIVSDLRSAWQKLEAQVFYHYVDHVMDNFSLRAPDPMMPMPMASDRDRRTLGARVLATLVPTASGELSVGLDSQENEHTDRRTMDQVSIPYQGLPRLEDARFLQIGLFGEWTEHLSEQRRLIAGLRLDDWRVEDRREMLAIGMADGMMMPDAMMLPNPTAGDEREETLTSGFFRYEQDLESVTFYAGLGHSERFPDYWELFSKEALTSISAFGAQPEKTTQLDIGAVYRGGRLSGSVSLFVNRIDDYLLIQSGVAKPMGAMGMRTTTVTRNVDAESFGMEGDLGYALNDSWRAEATVAYVHGDNETDGTPLAQMPPLELRLGLHYDNETWFAGLLWRAVAAQTRVDVGKGNIAGQDIGSSASFNVFSVNGGWHVTDNVRIAGGIDNLLDTTYAEHISKAGAMIAGYEQTTRVNEPGRTAWLKAQFSFE